MSLKLGTNTINKIYLGANEIKKAYLGANLIYDKTATPNGLLNNLVSYYKMDTNGSFPDAHGSNNGTINGASYTASGKINGGYSFDGVNDYVDIGNTGNSFGTIGFWIKANNGITNGTLEIPLNLRTNSGSAYIGIGEGTGVLTNETLGIYVNDSSLNPNFPRTAIRDIFDSNWHYVVFNWNGTKYDIYVDGVSRTTYASTNGGDVNNDIIEDLEIGRRGNASGYFDGVLDEMGFWDKTLSQTEITTLYNSGAGLSYDSFTT